MSESRKKIPYEKLVHLLQDGKIGFLQFVMNGDYAREYLEWCMAHSVEPCDDNAEFFLEMTEVDMMEHQFINNEYDGIW